MTTPTAAEIEAIRERDSTELAEGDSATTFTTRWSGSATGVECYGHVLQLMRDRRTLLAALDAVTAERDQCKALSETMNGIAIDKDVQLTELRAKYEKLNLQRAAAVGERDGYEADLASCRTAHRTLARGIKSVLGLAHWPEGMTDFADSEVKMLASHVDSLTTENTILRTCFCIEPDEKVVSSVEGSILIDNKSGTRRRYFTATDEERKLDDENERLRDIVEPLEKAAKAVRLGAYLDDDVINRHPFTTVSCEALKELFKAMEGGAT